MDDKELDSFGDAGEKKTGVGSPASIETLDFVGVVLPLLIFAALWFGRGVLLGVTDADADADADADVDVDVGDDAAPGCSVRIL